jgi:hypothetical protein
MGKDVHSVSIAMLSHTYGVVKNIFIEQRLYEVNLTLMGPCIVNIFQ